jgi:hypothetical protein
VHIPLAGEMIPSPHFETLQHLPVDDMQPKK